MDVTSLYTNIPQEEGIQTVCRTYNAFYENKPPIPTPLPAAEQKALKALKHDKEINLKKTDIKRDDHCCIQHTRHFIMF